MASVAKARNSSRVYKKVTEYRVVCKTRANEGLFAPSMYVICTVESFKQRSEPETDVVGTMAHDNSKQQWASEWLILWHGLSLTYIFWLAV